MPVSPKRAARAVRRRTTRRRTDAPVTESRRREILNEDDRPVDGQPERTPEVRHVADALEFSKANFYHHIDSKEQLLYDIFVDTLEYSLGHIEEIVGSDRSIPDQLRALVEFYVSLMFERRATMLVWFKERAHLTDAHQQEIGGLEQKIGTTLHGFYAKGIDAGYFKPMRLDVLRVAIFGMCFQLTRVPRPPDRAAMAEITRQLQELASTGLLTPTQQS